MKNFFDFYGLRHFLSDDESAILETFMRFADEITPHVDAAAWERKPYDKAWDMMAELGVFGAHIPEKYGGTGLSEVQYGLMMLALESADSSLRSSASVQNALVGYPILQFGSEQQKQKYLKKLAEGELAGAFGLTEPDHGSDPGSMKTVAKRTEQGFVINGAKQWITNADKADLFVVWAKLDGEIFGFLVEKGAEGLSAPAMDRRESLQAGHVGEIILQDVLIPLDNIMPQSKGLKSPLKCLNEARYSIAWGILGASMSLMNAAKEYTLNRTQFNKPIASFQLVQWKLADMAAKITAGLSLALHLGRLREAGKSKYFHVSLAKKMNCDAARSIAAMTRDLFGANGVSSEYPVMRIMKNIESVYTYEGTDHMHGLIVGEAITGIPAYR